MWTDCLLLAPTMTVTELPDAAAVVPTEATDVVAPGVPPRHVSILGFLGVAGAAPPGGLDAVARTWLLEAGIPDLRVHRHILAWLLGPLPPESEQAYPRLCVFAEDHVIFGVLARPHICGQVTHVGIR